MVFSGVVEFYGRYADSGGWFFCGWSSRWPSHGEETRVIAHFASGSINGQHLAAFYVREDIGQRGLGFILFVKEPSGQELGNLVALEIAFGGQSIRFAAQPAPRLGEASLRGQVLPLIANLGLLASDVDTGPFRALVEGEQRAQEIEFIRAAGLIDPEFYAQASEGAVATIDNVLPHFNAVGYRRGWKPNRYFDPAWYLDANPDVAEHAFNPLFHYAKWGDFEGRKPSLLFDPAFYRRQYGLPEQTAALAHYLQHRKSGKFSPIPEFDVEYYLRDAPELARSGLDPFEHYLLYGFLEGRRPSARFVADQRLDPEQNPLLDYLLRRAARERDLAAPEPVPTAPVRHSIPQDAEAAALLSPAGAGPAQAREFVARIMASPFVDEGLCHAHLGGGKDSVEAAELYLRLPAAARPALSYFLDRTYYFAHYPDLIGEEALDPLIHFVLAGCAERRSPHPLIDIEHIRRQDPFAVSEQPTTGEIYDVLQYDLADPSVYFLIDEYHKQLKELNSDLIGCLPHYLKAGHQLGLKPNLLFDPAWYYRQLDGAHDLWSGLRHFVLTGDTEALAPSPAFSSIGYLELNPDVAAAGVPPFAHYLRQGRREGRRIARLAPATSAQQQRVEAHGSRKGEHAEYLVAYQRAQDSAALLHQDKKEAVSVVPVNILVFDDPEAEMRRLKFPKAETPRVSILIPVYNELKYTVECLAAILRSKPKVSYELVVADDASTETAVRDLKNIKNLKVVRQPANVGFLENCNAGFAECRGEYLLLLNNDAQLLPGALDRMVRLLDEDPEVAAVGPKILYPDGRLQEAGCMLDRDGVSTMVGLFADPSEPGFDYDRDVHYCSGAALLVRCSEIGDELFDPAFKPAYCEDADLCLRLVARGKRVVYCRAAEVVHHLSVSTNKQSVTRRLQAVARNQQKLTEKWTELLEDLNKARVIAFYLPQYHPTPENDFYWGQGFTEWSNVARATPAYVGHYQPHLPADLGFYDLRVKQTIERQSRLARRYGVAGFCVYYYNFGERRALDQAFEAVVSDRTIDFPYCVCWANENWTRHWDGGSREIIFEQQYDPAALAGIIADAVRYAADPRYLTVNGKPLFLVYRPLLIEGVRDFAENIREAFREAGFPGAHLVYVESMETAERGMPPSELGFDASVEFPPHGLAVPMQEPGEALRDGFVGKQYDYQATLLQDLKRPLPGYKRYPAVFPSWDNTPRQPLRGDSFVGATPEAFQIYLEEKLERVRSFLVGEERLLFVNAWNEWAEGTHLEPDQRFGHRWLEAIRNALLAKSLI